MKVILTSGDFGTWELTPVNKRVARRMERETGNESILIQTDWDFPGLARSLGWNMRLRKRCDHRGTDGTVDCPDCGTTASEFIAGAVAWLDAHNGCVFRGKGEEYFN